MEGDVWWQGIAGTCMQETCPLKHVVSILLKCIHFFVYFRETDDLNGVIMIASQELELLIWRIGNQ